MSNNSNRKIVFASILGAILATGLLALNSTIGNAQAQMYVNEYGYDNGYNNNYYYPESKNSQKGIQKISCLNSNINVNGIDITKIPHNDLTTNELIAHEQLQGGTNDDGPEHVINFDRNLVDVCLNLNFNQQLKVTTPDEETCEDCFSILSAQVINRLLDNIQAVLDTLQIEAQIDTLADLCEFLATNTSMTKTDKWRLLDTTLSSEGVSQEDEDRILLCLKDLGLIDVPG